MNNHLKFFFTASIVAVLSSCTSETKQSASASTPSEVATDTNKVIAEDTTQNAVQTITGKVDEVTFGKDGYTAKLTTDSKEVYFATVSHANLDKNAHQYREVKVGETIELTGEVWKMGEETHVTVRELK